MSDGPRGRIRPAGLAAFVRSARAMRKNLRISWRDAIRTAWNHGPIR